MVKYLFFKQKKDNSFGKMVSEMDCIPLRNWINRRITESQSRRINWFGMYAVNNNNIGTCTSYPSLLQRLGFTLFYDPIREIANCGVQFFYSFEEVDIWGRLCNHQAVVLRPFFLNLAHFTLLVLFSVSWVGTHNKGQLKAVVRSQKH